MRAALRVLLETLVRFFYRSIAVSGAGRAPCEGPVLVVSNHPNALVDPVILRLALDRPIAFLAKSTFFKIPVAKLVMEAFGAIPIYRAVDGQSTQRNDETFARCRALLARKGWVAIFPEGTTHSEPSLKPFKTGAARIALGALEERGASLGLRILPAGLLYEDKSIFRSRVAVSLGTAIDLAGRLEEHARDPRAAVERLTQDIEEALRSVTLEAETRQMWDGFVAVAAWTRGHTADDLARREARARELARAWKRLAAREPDRAEAVVAFTRRFVRMLRAVGIRDPLHLDAKTTPSLGAVLASTAPLVLIAPFALVGSLLGWLPYRTVKPLAVSIARGQTELIGTIKLLLGLAILTTAYLAEAVAAGIWFGPPVGIAVFVGAPFTGYLALRFHERLTLRREALRAHWLRWRGSALAREIAARRRELAAMVEAELGTIGAEPGPKVDLELAATGAVSPGGG